MEALYNIVLVPLCCVVIGRTICLLNVLIVENVLCVCAHVLHAPQVKKKSNMVTTLVYTCFHVFY